MDAATLLAEAETRNVTDRSADTVIRNDPVASGELWAEDGAWKIAPPMDVQAQGRRREPPFYDNFTPQAIP